MDASPNPDYSFYSKNQVISSSIFTINNYTEDDKQRCLSLIPISNVVLCSFEVGKECGTPHIQGYATLKDPVRFKAWRALLPRAHFPVEGTKGGKEAQYKYIFKIDSIEFIKHDIGGRGKRNDIHDAVKLMRRKGLKRVAETAPCTYVKFHRGLKALREELQEFRPRDQAPTIIWLYGESEFFKTRFVWDTFGDDNVGQWAGGDQWFDSYMQQRVLLLDDLRSTNCKFVNLLRLTDRYPMLLPIKNGFVKKNSEYVIITSPFHPEKVYDDLRFEDKIYQLTRRISVIQEFDGKKEILWKKSFQAHIQATTPHSEDESSEDEDEPECSAEQQGGEA